MLKKLFFKTDNYKASIKVRAIETYPNPFFYEVITDVQPCFGDDAARSLVDLQWQLFKKFKKMEIQHKGLTFSDSLK